MASRTGVARLPLHYGVAPRWLVSRMKRLAKEMVAVIVDEYGAKEFLKRISNPYWFQALGCTLGYDWHSSGVTTVTTGVLRSVIKPEEVGLAVAGGKGKRSLKTPSELGDVGTKFSLSSYRVDALKYASRMCAKVDNAAIQAGYPLYHHAFFLSEKGDWAVVQQGMDIRDKVARRYHWLSSDVKSFVSEPHSAIVCDVRRGVALDMTARSSEECRQTCVDVAKEKPRRILRMMKSIRPRYQRSLLDYFPVAGEREKEYVIDVLYMPKNVNWKAISKVYEFQPKNYEQLLGIRGMGPATVRGLALISELIYGSKPSWKDPVKYSFAFGGKDGVPFPVKRREMDEATRFLSNAVKQANLGKKEELGALNRLRKYVPKF